MVVLAIPVLRLVSVLRQGATTSSSSTPGKRRSDRRGFRPGFNGPGCWSRSPTQRGRGRTAHAESTPAPGPDVAASDNEFARERNRGSSVIPSTSRRTRRTRTYPHAARRPRFRPVVERGTPCSIRRWHTATSSRLPRHSPARVPVVLVSILGLRFPLMLVGARRRLLDPATAAVRP